MKTILSTLMVFTGVIIQCYTAAAQSAADPGWPRVFKLSGQQLTVYQPQVDSWNGFTNLHCHCAIAVQGVTAQEQYGVAEIDALTVVDRAARIVALFPSKRVLQFPGASESDAAALRDAVNQLRPPSQALTVSLDRVLACLNPVQTPAQQSVSVNLNPPTIFYSGQPAILVMFLGQPQFKPIATNRTDLVFAVNSNWDVFYDTVGQKFYLLNQDTWLTAASVNGPWTDAQNLPASFTSLPANDNWATVRRNVPGAATRTAPVVFVSMQPAELILTKGEPIYVPIPGTQLLRVSNTDSTLFLYSGQTQSQFYFLVAGRWFWAPALAGPWSAASGNLPPDFAQIPDSDPSAVVKASVPGTRNARDAALMASVPTTTTINLTNATVQVAYNGLPVFRRIAGTDVQYAINTPFSVLMADEEYFCCDQGVWFTSATCAGPWSFCTNVAPAIYTIPPSSPLFNVTFVTVQSFTPTTVTYCQTAGYSGEYVGTTGTVMFGAGMTLGADTALQDTQYDCYPVSVYYSYGYGAAYNYGYGGYYYPAYTWYGPYGGVGYATAYNPATGTYARAAYAYGPYGSAGVKQAYNPYTGGYARAAQVNTAYGSATRAYAYNPTTGNSAWAGARTSAYGTVGAIKTSQGSGAAAWNTQNGQGAVAKAQSGDVYAANDGTVYKRNSDGSWSQSSPNGWQNISHQQPATAANQSYQNVQAQAQSRDWGNQQAQQAQAWQNSGNGGRSYGGGGGGGGRRR